MKKLLLTFSFVLFTSLYVSSQDKHPIGWSSYRLQKLGFSVIEFESEHFYCDCDTIGDYFVMGLENYIQPYDFNEKGSLFIDTSVKYLYNIVLYDDSKEWFYFPFENKRIENNDLEETFDVYPKPISLLEINSIYFSGKLFNNKKGELIVEVHLSGGIINRFRINKKDFID